MEKKTSGFAITSLILGIISLFLGWIPLLGWIMIVLSILFGIIALFKISKNNTLQGKGLAIAGIILGAISLIIVIFFFGVFMLALNDISEDNKTEVKVVQSSTDEIAKNQNTEEVSGSQTVHPKEALDIWSQNIPTEYQLDEIGNYCSQIQTSPPCASHDMIDRSDIVEGYKQIFSKSNGEVGKGEIILFENQDIAKIYFDKIVNDVKEKRGYSDIPVPDNCFGWKKDFNLYDTQEILCYKKDLLYKVGLQGNSLYSQTTIKSLQKDFSKLIV